MAVWWSHGNISDVAGDPGLMAVLLLLAVWLAVRDCRAYPRGLSPFARWRP